MIIRLFVKIRVFIYVLCVKREMEEKKERKKGKKIDLNIFKIPGIINGCLKIYFDSLCL